MSLLKQPWFLIFLIIVGIYSYSGLSGDSKVSLSLNEAQAEAKKKGKKRSKKLVGLSLEFAASSIDTLKVDGYESMDVSLEASSTDKLVLEIEGRGGRYLNSGKQFSDWLQTRLSNGILKISPAIEEGNVEFSDLFKGNDDLKLTVRYPKTQKFTEIEVLTISGNIEMQGTFSETIHLKSVSGDVDFTKVNCKNLRVEAVSSDLDLSSIFAANMEIKTVSGDATISTRTELPNYTFKSVSGDFDLKLPKSALVDVNFKSMTGDLINQFTKKSETAGSIEVSSMSGDAQITKVQ